MTTPAISVPDFIAGYGPQQSDMTTLWSDPLAFFQARVVFRASQTSGATSLPSSGALTTIAFNNIIEDPYSGWNASTHKWEAPAGFSGQYLATVNVWVAAPGATDVTLVGEVGLATGTSDPLVAVVLPNNVSGISYSYYYYLVGGQDVLYAAAYIQNSSSAVSTSLTAGENSTLEVMWISS